MNDQQNVMILTQCTLDKWNCITSLFLSLVLGPFGVDRFPCWSFEACEPAAEPRPLCSGVYDGFLHHVPESILTYGSRCWRLVATTRLGGRMMRRDG